MEGLLSACQPQPQGPPQPSSEQQLARLERELAKCRQECQRQASLVRAAERAIGLSAVEPSGRGKAQTANEGGARKAKRRRRPTVRALRCACAPGLAERTLRHWRRRVEQQRLRQQRRRGRPPVRCEAELRNEAIRFLHHVTGPSVGLPALRCLFPQLRRCVLWHLLRRYRRLWRRRYRRCGFRLTWHHAGAVWAMDHSEPLHPVDGVYPYPPR